MKGQSAIELITYLVIGLLITMVFLASIGPYEQNVMLERKAILGREILWKVAAELNGAASVGDGYERIMVLPGIMRDGSNYSIELDVEYQVVRIFWGEGGGGYGLPIITSNVTGSFQPGVNRITNSDGVILVEAA